VRLLLIATAKSEVYEFFPPQPGNFPLADTRNVEVSGNLRPTADTQENRFLAISGTLKSFDASLEQ
jgi:hypothetical protein